MKIQRFKIALQLFPALSDNPESAVQNMRRLIKGDPELSAKLMKCGYKARSRYITKRQADLILYYLE